MSQYKYPVKGGFKWMTKFQYTDPKNGEVKTKYKRGFDTKKQAKQFEEDFIEALETPEEDEIVRTYGDVFQEYLASHKRADMKETTLETKFNIFNQHIFPTFEDVPIESITDDDIAEWQEEIKLKTRPDGKQFSEAYLRTIQCQFNTVINYAAAKGYIKINPLADIKNMGVKDKRIDFWTPKEYEKFAYYAMEYPRYYYAYEILYWCGLRLGELLALTLEDIDLEQKLLRVNKTYNFLNGKEFVTAPKTPSSVRTVSLPSFLVDEIQEYIDTLYQPTQTQRLFDFKRSQIGKNFITVTNQAGLKRITVHGLRHSHVSLLINKKHDIFEVSKRIGHKSILTTQNTYGHLFDDAQRTIANELDQIRLGE